MLTQEVKQVFGGNPLYAIKTQMSSIITTGTRTTGHLSNVLSAKAENLGYNLSYRIVLGDPSQADNLTLEIIEDGEIVPIEFTDGLIQIDCIIANTSIPTFITFNAEDTYIFIIELIDTDTGTLLDNDIKTMVARIPFNSTP